MSKNLHPTSNIAQVLRSTLNFAKDAGGRLYVYSKGRYVDGGEQVIRQEVKKYFIDHNAEHLWTNHKASEVVRYIQTDAPELWDRPPVDVLNLKNGLLEIETRKLRRHTPKHLSTVQLPVKYFPSAHCPAWDRFADEVAPEGCVDLLWEVIGYLLVPDTSLQKAILLYGPGGNGKTTFLNAVSLLIGTDNISNVSLQDLVGQRFARASLVGKLANICGDLPQRRLSDTDVFKSVVGGDALEVERKFQPRFTVQPFARLVFSANHYPVADDKSQGFFDRWLVIPFLKRFRGDKQERSQDDLLAELGRPLELSGALNRALDGLDRLREYGRFSECKAVQEAGEQFRSETDPVGAWIESNTIPDPNGTTFCDDFFLGYSLAAKQERVPGLTDANLAKAVYRVRPSVQKAKRGPRGEQRACYIGMRLREVG